jgi:hypothetical protein
MDFFEIRKPFNYSLPRRVREWGSDFRSDTKISEHRNFWNSGREIHIGGFKTRRAKRPQRYREIIGTAKSEMAKMRN